MTVSVCSRPCCTRPCTIDCASSAVMRPRSTASFTTSSIRSRVSMIRLSGRITPFVIASRSSATFLPEKSSPRAAAAALSPVCLAAFCAVCWRPRALPPAFAARLRAVLLPLDDRLVLDLRALDVERPLEELDDDDELALRPRPPDPLAADLRAPPDELDLRAPP